MPYPLAEQYLGAGRIQEYTEACKQYLIANPRSFQAARLTMDLYMLGKVANDDRTAVDARGGLLFQFADSLPAAYIVETFKDEPEFRQFILTEVEHRAAVLARTSVVMANHAIGLGLRRFGDKLLGEEAFALVVALIAEEAGNGVLHQKALAAFDGPDKARPGLKEIRTACFGSPAGPSARPSIKERVLRLHALRAEGNARLFEWYYAAKLAPADRQDPQVLRILAENDVLAGKVSDACVSIKALLAKQTDAQLLLWLAWCHFGMGQKVEARARLEELQKVPRHAVRRRGQTAG
jgi:hypothetical protein